MFKSMFNTLLGLGLGLGVWGSQIALQFLFPRPAIELPAGTGLGDIPGIARMALVVVLIALGIGALTTSWMRDPQIQSAMWSGALAAAGPYVIVYYGPALWQFIPLAWQSGNGANPAFWDFVARALWTLAQHGLVFFMLAAVGGGLGGLLVILGRRWTLQITNPKIQLSIPIAGDRK